MHHQDAERRDAPDPHEADEVVVLSVVGGTQPCVPFLELALLAYVGYRGPYHPGSRPTDGSDTPKMSLDWLLKSIGQAHHPYLKGDPKCSQVKPAH